MKTIRIADATLRMAAVSADNALGFKEKIEIVRQLNRLHVDAIETALLRNGKSDVLFLHSAASIVDGILSCPVLLDESAITATWDAVKVAQRPRLNLLAPVSTVQMEYQLHQKPAAALESIGKMTRLAKQLGAQVEVSLMDATRAEQEFLVMAAQAAVDNGADVVTICDTAGTMFPPQFVRFIADLVEAVPQLKNVELSVECSDAMHIATACAAQCLELNVTQFRTAIDSPDALSLSQFGDLLRIKGRALQTQSNLNMTNLHKIVTTISEIIQDKQEVASTKELAARSAEQAELFLLSAADDMESVASAVAHLGYDLSADDLGKVYEEVCRISEKKKVGIGLKDLDAIVATVALQAPPVYQLKSFVINSGNQISAMANVILVKDGEEVQGFSIGDGPVDAAFMSIENIVGRHFELDDFKISAVTEGREAVGSSVVRLRSRGKLYSGKGVSTDIIGAAIRAYINALNKICYDEEEKE